jgi:TetR/AcrR family transcriptional regulator, transcriptional repressor of aconitase
MGMVCVYSRSGLNEDALSGRKQLQEHGLVDRLTWPSIQNRNRAGVDEVAHACVEGNSQEIARSEDVHLIELSSVDLIAESVGFSKGAFYSNFESKESIFREPLEARKNSEIEELGALLARNLSGEELLTIVRQYQPGHMDDFDCTLLTAAFELQACRDATLAKAYARLHRSHRDKLAGLIAKLFLKLGREAPSTPEDLADLLMAMTVGLSLQRVAIPERTRKRLTSEAGLLILGLAP